MPDERKTAIQILRKARGHKLTMAQLGNKLAQNHALGFGVEADDVVFALERLGLVKYDRRHDVITLAVSLKKNRTK